MRSKGLVILLATLAGIVRADGGVAMNPPRADMRVWTPSPSTSALLASGELAALHSSGYAALSDVAQPVDKGLAAYKRIAEILATSHDIEDAQNAYLEIVRELAFFSVGRGVELVPDDMLANASILALTDSEKALVHFLKAWKLAKASSPEKRAKAGAEFVLAEALEPVELHEQMLLHYLAWAEKDGFSEIVENGHVKTSEDYEKAIEICNRIVATAKNRATIDYAVECVKNIRNPDVSLTVDNSFRTGSQAQFGLRWKNCDEVTVSLYPVRLDQIPLSGDATSLRNLAASITVPDNSEPVRRMTRDTPPLRKFYPVDDPVSLDDLVLPGAYLVKAESVDCHAEDVILVTDSMLAMKMGRSRILVYACNAQTGHPIPGAEITLWTRIRRDTLWSRAQKVAGADGIAVFSGEEIGNTPDATSIEAVAFATKDQQQAVATYSPKVSAAHDRDKWLARVFIDSGDYMPGDKVHLLALVRRDTDDGIRNAAGEDVLLEIAARDGSIAGSAKTKVDVFGMAEATIDLPATTPVGTYTASVRRVSDSERIDGTNSFNIHGNYTPDYNVSISINEGGAKDSIIAGNPFGGRVRVAMPFGGPVAAQVVDLVVDERPYNIRRGRATGPWKTVFSTQARTNSRGEVPFSYPTKVSAAEDCELRVKATVADSDDSPSVATGSTFVTRQPYYADLRTDALLYGPGHGVKLQLVTKSAKGIPLPCVGTLRLLRESWKEVWTDRRGHEITGEELRKLRQRGSGWFSLGQNAGDYVLKSQGYETEVVTEETLETDAQGTAYYVWNDVRPGYFRFIWLGEGPNSTVVSAEREFWVSGSDYSINGYKPNGIRLVSDPIDPDSDRTMITVPDPDQSVLVTTGSGDIDSWSLIKLGGTAQIIENKTNAGSPTQYLEAFYVNDEKPALAVTLLKTPAPAGLKVMINNVKSDYMPGEDANLVVNVTDGQGVPVQGARLAFWITGTMRDAPTPPVELFPQTPHKPDIVTTDSSAVRPFFQPAAADMPSLPTDTVAVGQAPRPDESTSDDSMYDVNETPTAKTALWISDKVTDKNGSVALGVKMPREISLWSLEAVASVENGSAGACRITATTNEPLSVSINVPGTIYAGDVVELLATLLNNQAAETTLAFSMSSADVPPSSPLFETAYLKLEPNTSTSTGWRLSFSESGRTSIVADAHNADRTLKCSSVTLVKPDPSMQAATSSIYADSAEIALPTLPKGSTILFLDYAITTSPSRIALAALPYLLADQSDGSTEAAARIAAVDSIRRLFTVMRYQPDAVEKGLAQCGAGTYAKNREERDVETLLSSQATNGAWGWMSPESANCFASAYNLILLNLCDDETAARLKPALAKAREYAAAQLVADDTPPDLRAALLYALASREAGQTRPSRLEARALVDLMRAEDNLGPFALACLALSAKQYGFDEEANRISSRISANVVRSTVTGGLLEASWKGSTIPDAIPASEVENTAMSLLAILSTRGAKDSLVEPATRFLYRKSVNGHWDGPRETSICILALREISVLSSETDLDAKCAVVGDGENAGVYDSALDNALEPPAWNELKLTGANSTSVRISRIGGDTPVFATLRATLACGPSAPAVSSMDGLSLTRRYYKTIQVPTLLHGADDRVVEMNPAETLHVGDRLEAVVTLTSATNLQTLMVSIPQPAFASWHGQTITPALLCRNNPELKPGKVLIRRADGAFLVSVENLPAGTWEIRCPERVEFAGEFAIPPVRAWIPQRESLSAESDRQRVKCVPGDSTTQEK
jgi:hypothetical protein